MQASAPPMANTAFPQYPATQYPSEPVQPGQPQTSQTPRQQQPVPATLGTRPPPAARAPDAGPVPVQPAAPVATNGEQRSTSRSSNNNSRRNAKSVTTAAASLETVERALGDLRVSNASANAAHPHANGPRSGGGRRGGGRTQEIKVPQTDFDFAGSNALFDKASLAPQDGSVAKEDDEQTNPSEDGRDTKSPVKESKKETEAYNPKASFFDSLSSGNAGPPQNQGPRGGGGGGRRGHGRNRREEEREKNVATFGEPGGVGLMGPGAYVPGWGGYGRRGGGRGGRRGAPAGIVGGR